jgi:hypothetical protein
MTDTLNPSLSKEYQVEVYTQAPRDISVPGETVMKIKMEIPSGGEYIFSDVPSLNLEVDNKLKYRIALTAGNYIDDGSGETSLEVPALTSKTACIYTDNPRFTVTPPGYSAIEWKITNGTMYVTVK